MEAGSAESLSRSVVVLLDLVYLFVARGFGTVSSLERLNRERQHVYK